MLDVYPLAREAANPAAAVDEIFDLISPGWDAAVTRSGKTEVVTLPPPTSNLADNDA